MNCRFLNSEVGECEWWSNDCDYSVVRSVVLHQKK